LTVSFLAEASAQKHSRYFSCVVQSKYVACYVCM
jgi:hypothetical protein